MKTILTRNYGERWHRVTKLTPHHWAVVGADPETIARNFDKNGNSANYVIGNDGTLILCVPEEFRAFTSDNPDNDSKAVTVEMANETGAPEWRVSDAAIETLINLGVGVCKRHGLPGFKWTGDATGTLTIHKFFAATVCPGPYLESKMPYIAEEITRRVQEGNDMVYTINLEELKSKGYTEVKIELGKASDIAPTTPAPELIKIGDLVRMSKDATIYGQTNKFADFIYSAYLYVRELNGNRAVVSTNPQGAVTGPVDVKYLTRV